MSQRMPALFFGHGNPMNALLVNPYTEKWAALGRAILRPKAIVCISAHWYIQDAAVTISTAPKTIHDFGGFPQDLYQVQYPAPGDPALAARVQKLLAPLPVRLDERWGLDHGTWSVLRHVYPHADVPVVQLSIDETQPPSFHYEIGKRLAPLREEGILIVGSGNVVHNLHAYAWGRRVQEPYDWPSRSRTECANCSWPRSSRRLSITRINLAAKRISPFLPPTTIFRCCTLSERARHPSPSHFL